LKPLSVEYHQCGTTTAEALTPMCDITNCITNNVVITMR
jgi:hypothetical protein